jgi:hypothetical protein
MSRVQQEFDDDNNQDLFDSFDAAHVTPGIAENKKLIADGVAGSTVILWHRAVQFKQISLKMVVSRVLQQQHQAHSRLVIPGELKLKDVQIPAPSNRQQFHICMSSHQAESASIRSQIMKAVMAAPSRTQSRSERVLQSIGRTNDKHEGVPPQQLRVGVVGEGGCTIKNSSNFLLFLSTRNLLNKELMDDVRSALLLDLNVITIHNKGTDDRFQNLSLASSDVASLQIPAAKQRSSTASSAHVLPIYEMVRLHATGRRLTAQGYSTALLLIGSEMTQQSTRK